MIDKLVTFLHRERSGEFNLYACRGTGKKCPHKRARKKKCDDCVKGRPEETIEQLLIRIERGDA